MRTRVLAFLVALSIFVTSARARADEAGPPEDPDRAVLRVVIWTSYAVSAVGFATSFIFLAQANSVYADRREIARQNQDENSPVWGCSSPEQCAEMASLREDQEAAKNRWGGAIGVGLAGAIAGTGFLIPYLLGWPKASTSASTATIAPSVGAQSAGLHLQGRF